MFKQALPSKAKLIQLLGALAGGGIGMVGGGIAGGVGGSAGGYAAGAHIGNHMTDAASTHLGNQNFEEATGVTADNPALPEEAEFAEQLRQRYQDEIRSQLAPISKPLGQVVGGVGGGVFGAGAGAGAGGVLGAGAGYNLLRKKEKAAQFGAAAGHAAATRITY